MLAAPSLIHASAACLSSDAYNHKGMKTLPMPVGLGASKFVRRAPACHIQTDGALRRADDAASSTRWYMMLRGSAANVDSQFPVDPHPSRRATGDAGRLAPLGLGFHWRRETLAMLVGAALVVDRRAKADFRADRYLLHSAVVVAHGQRDIDPVADFQRPGEPAQPKVIVTGRQSNFGFGW